MSADTHMDTEDTQNAPEIDENGQNVQNNNTHNINITNTNQNPEEQSGETRRAVRRVQSPTSHLENNFNFTHPSSTASNSTGRRYHPPPRNSTNGIPGTAVALGHGHMVTPPGLIRFPNAFGQVYGVPIEQALGNMPNVPPGGLPNMHQGFQGLGLLPGTNYINNLATLQGDHAANMQQGSSISPSGHSAFLDFQERSTPNNRSNQASTNFNIFNGQRHRYLVNNSAINFSQDHPQEIRIQTNQQTTNNQPTRPAEGRPNNKLKMSINHGSTVLADSNQDDSFSTSLTGSKAEKFLNDETMSSSVEKASLKNYTADILRESQLAAKVKLLIKCYKCGSVSENQVYQAIDCDPDKDLQIICGNCILNLSAQEEAENPQSATKPKYIRNISAEKICFEILQPLISPQAINRCKNKLRERTNSTSKIEIEKGLSQTDDQDPARGQDLNNNIRLHSVSIGAMTPAMSVSSMSTSGRASGRGSFSMAHRGRPRRESVSINNIIGVAPTNNVGNNQSTPIMASTTEALVNRASNIENQPALDSNNNPGQQQQPQTTQTHVVTIATGQGNATLSHPSLASTPMDSSTKEEKEKRVRAYTLPSDIVEAIAEYEKNKTDLAVRLQKCTTCCCCYDTIRPLSIAQNLQGIQMGKFIRGSAGEDSDDDGTSEICCHGIRRQPFNCKQLTIEDKENFQQKLMRLFQCENGHLLCEVCISRLLADGRLRNVETRCPFCRIPLNFSTVYRNRVIEEIICLLKVECEYCYKKFIYDDIIVHEKFCDRKPVNCEFKILGCQWTGENVELKEHHKKCPFFAKKASDLQDNIKEFIDQRSKEREMNTSILRLYSKRLAFVDFQLNANRTDEYISRLYFKSGNISALGRTFSVKLWVGGIDPHYPTASATRHLEYQIQLRGNRSQAETMALDHILVTPPPGRYKIKPICNSDVLGGNCHPKAGQKWKLNMTPTAINLVLGNSGIILRLYMFLS